MVRQAIVQGAAGGDDDKLRDVALRPRFLREVIGQKIDNGVTEFPHLFSGQSEAGAIRRGILFLLFQARQGRVMK